MSDKPTQRIAYLDWMRGFACLLMFQTHCYDSWLGGPARSTDFFRYTQAAGTLPAPLFLFLAGVSIALVTDRKRQKGLPEADIARATILRGAEIFGYGLLLRLQEFLLGQPWAPWTDLLRVDILNMIGLSLILVGIVSGVAAIGAGIPTPEPSANLARAARLRARTVGVSAAVAAGIALITPLVWTTRHLAWMPWVLESYLNGVHTFKVPQPWLFPLFPWAAFTFAGLAIGLLLLSPWALRHELPSIGIAGAAALLFICLGQWLDALPRQLYAVYDFWHTSPNFFLIRLGILIAIIPAAYLWCRWGLGQRGFSPLIELGRSSLLVYWVHIEFVYGRFSILHKGAQSIASATVGLIVIFAAMTALATVNNRRKGRSWWDMLFVRESAVAE